MLKLTDILNLPVIYKLWQYPFYQQKVFFLKEDLKNKPQTLTVLDLGCGPGTNIHLFDNHQYTGVDLNPLYIRNIQVKHNRKLVCQDVNQFLINDKNSYDLILINSLMHHLDDAQTDLLLSLIPQKLNRSGKIYIFDLILPDQESIPKLLALNDRGKFARSKEKWTELFLKYFSCIESKDYYLSLLGIKLWSMIYFKGKSFEQ